MATAVRSLGVVGLGVLGAGIAQVAASGGFEVIGVERDDAACGRAASRLRRHLGHAVATGHLTDEQALHAADRVLITTDLKRVAGCDLIIEAVDERLELKQAIFADLDTVCPSETVLATATDALPVTDLALATSRPSQVVGMHWFTPAEATGIIEVVRTVVTRTEVLDQVVDTVTALGRTAVLVGDRTGFVSGALLFPYLNNAVHLLEAGYATRDDIDAAMRYGCGHPLGPLALLDLIGLDTACLVLEALYARTGDHLHAPAPLLRQLAAAGRLGRKSGRGFYLYASGAGWWDAPLTDPLQADAAAAGDGGGAAPREVHRVGVVGSGTMATGIAEVLAKSGFEVLVRARSADKAASVLAAVDASVQRAVTKGRMAPEAAAETLARVRTTTRLEDLGACELVIEAVVEQLAAKRELFARLDEIVGPGTVLATTTSSLAIVDCATATTRAQDLVGMHWFNPAPAMRLVEIAGCVLTSPEAVATVTEVARRCGKHPVQCGDRAGFIVNALLFPYLNDAVRILEAHSPSIAGVTPAEPGGPGAAASAAGATGAVMDVVDTVMTAVCRHPMGPFALLDVVGLDVSLAIQRALHREFREPGLAPSVLLEHLVSAGHLGRKTGQGFRRWPAR